MKTSAIISKSKMIITGIVLLNCLMTSCMTGKSFSDKMKYTYYKKVKAESRKESTNNTAGVSSERKETILFRRDNVVLNSKVLPQVTDSKNADNNVKVKRSNPVTFTKNNSAKAPETKKDKVKRILSEKIRPLFASKSNLKDANGTRQNVLVTILLVLLIILLAYIVIVLLFFALFNAMGGFSISC